jgi:sugar phosphate isomerase/epimerase
MIQIGIRLHDVNTTKEKQFQTLEERAKTARAEGFSCVHLALGKVIPGVAFDEAAMTEGLAMRVKRVFGQSGLDVAVLGCYLNLAHPDPAKRKEIQARYFAHIRLAALAGICTVGTETGAPNTAYTYEPACHGREALTAFMRGLEPVVAEAERRGVTLAIEPVWNHIVWNPDRALEVVRAMGSRNLRIIFDPVNLLAPENVDARERVIGEAMDKLCDRIAVVHIKDFLPADGKLKSVAAGAGKMDYSAILSFLKARKPYVQATLENTDDTNAVQSRELIERLYREAL